MPQPWLAREVEVILPIATVKAMFERAPPLRRRAERPLRRARGRGTAVVDVGPERERRAARLLLRQVALAPTEARATIWKVEWDPTEGGSEEEVWTAFELLSGGAVRRT